MIGLTIPKSITVEQSFLASLFHGPLASQEVICLWVKCPFLIQLVVHREVKLLHIKHGHLCTREHPEPLLLAKSCGCGSY